MTYISSIIMNYNDSANVKKDAATLLEIYKRQGQHIFLETLADQTGEAAKEMDTVDSLLLMSKTVNKLKELILERI